MPYKVSIAGINMRTIGHLRVGQRKAHQWMADSSILLAGFLSLILDASPSLNHETAHVLFGLLLSIGILFRFHLWTRAPQPSFEQARTYVRRSSRMIYGVLYGLLLFKLLLNLFIGLVEPSDGFSPYFGAGAAALLLTRVLAYASLRAPSVRETT